MSRNLVTQEVAARYRTSESTVRYWRMIGKEPGSLGVRCGRRVLYDEAELDRYDERKRAERRAERRVGGSDSGPSQPAA